MWNQRKYKQILQKPVKNHSRIIQNSCKNDWKLLKSVPCDPQEAKFDSGMEFWMSKVPKWCENGSQNEVKMNNNLKKTSSKNAMISEGRCSWILMIFHLILDQILSIVHHFFKKSKKLKNMTICYIFEGFSIQKTSKIPSEIRPRKRRPPKVVKSSFFDDFGPRLGSQNHKKTHENHH